ncbi:hypothetical protein [Rugamonas sp.]|uniref:hypothetical protein n=1 Tax=Rugamonas sp. TaxID=1926287 RepID=UPI0025FEDB26|nr:hypothetical protein [Rugamonas sp.]
MLHHETIGPDVAAGSHPASLHLILDTMPSHAVSGERMSAIGLPVDIGTPSLREAFDLLGFVLAQLPKRVVDLLCERLFSLFESATLEFPDGGQVTTSGARCDLIVLRVAGVHELISGTLLAA